MPLGPTELIIILVLVLIIFGAGKLPEVGSALGKGMKEFRKAKAEITDIESSIKSDLSLDAKPVTPKVEKVEKAEPSEKSSTTA